MAQNITPLIAGNWKMNGLRASLFEVEKLASLLTSGEPPRCTVAICPPATLINAMNRIAAPASTLKLLEPPPESKLRLVGSRAYSQPAAPH